MNWIKMKLQQLLCALDGHGGVSFQIRPDMLGGPEVHYHCKRCGKDWIE